MAWPRDDKARTSVAGEYSFEDEARVVSPPDSYHHARRNVVLVGALLLCWEVLKISVESLESSRGVLISIDYPDAIPWVAIGFLGYFSMRYWIEWNLLDPLIRLESAAQLDLKATWVIASLGVIVFLGQRVVQTVDIGQLFGELSAASGMAAALGAVIAAISGIVTWVTYMRAHERAKRDAESELERVEERLVELREVLKGLQEDAEERSPELSSADQLLLQWQTSQVRELERKREQLSKELSKE